MKFATIDDFHQYVRNLQRRPAKDGGEVVPSDDEMKEACEYLALRFRMLREDIVDLEFLHVIRPASKVSLRKHVGPEIRCMIRDLRAAWEAMEDRAGIAPDGAEYPF